MKYIGRWRREVVEGSKLQKSSVLRIEMRVFLNSLLTTQVRQETQQPTRRNGRCGGGME